jgi:elongation factor Ts
MAINAQDIKILRDETGVGMMQAKEALEAAGGDKDKAIAELRKQGQKVLSKKQERTAGEGWIGTYVHHNGKVGAMVELRCETDFVSRGKDFQEVAQQLAMHIAAAAPTYLKLDDVPAELKDQEEEIALVQLRNEGKNEEMIAKILPSKVAKALSDRCLLEQGFVLDDKKTVQQLIADATLKLGEKIEVTRFTRFAF